MFAVDKKISFSLIVTLIIGLGVFALLMMNASATLLQAQTYELDRPVRLPAGVRLKLQIDKEVYRSGDAILIAIRNDSKLGVYLAEHADGCQGAWWQVEMLMTDGSSWGPVPTAAQSCPAKVFGLVEFKQHTILSGEWSGQVPAGQFGDLHAPAPTGSYRISVPYLKGAKSMEEDWGRNKHRVVSSIFTLQ